MNVTVTETDAEYLERDRLWHQNKRDSDPTLREREAEYSRAYYQSHKVAIAERSKEYHKQRRIEHPEEVRAKAREKHIRYVANNKDKLDAYKKHKTLCECGSQFLTYHKSAHLHTKKHQKFLSIQKIV